MINSDTIVALATPAGGAIGVLRLSGPDALTVTGRLFSPIKAGSAGDGAHQFVHARPNSLHYGHLHTLDGEDIDDVMVCIYRAPHSYTGEDCTEISCHGSAYVLHEAIKACIDAGARQATPGEYTQRAYLNGKMDLSQAEAVADLVSATNRATHKMALSQLKGHFSSELSLLREQLLKITSLLELELDFSDHEELEFANRDELETLAVRIDHRITTLARSFETGNALKQGIPVAIVGKTNVGKSTLLNRLLHEERAIVSDIHGTTRDVIEDSMTIQGIPFRFIDTAGIRTTCDKIEQLGIARTYQKLDEATIVLWLTDATPTPEEMADMQRRTHDKHLIMVRTKIDLHSPTPETTNATTSVHSLSANKPGATIYISTKLGLGLDTLESALLQAADIPDINESSVIITSARHYEALSRAHDNLSRVLQGMRSNFPTDLIAEDLRLVLDDLADITGRGRITPQETLHNIFSHFCIGK